MAAPARRPQRPGRAPLVHDRRARPTASSRSAECRLTDLVAEHGSPAYVLDEADFRARARGVPRRVRDVRRLLRRQGVPVHGHRPVDRGGGPLPRRVLGRRADRGRAGRLRPGPDRLPRQQQDRAPSCAAPSRWASAGSSSTPSHEIDRLAAVVAELGAHHAGDGAGDRGRRGAHPRVHRHRARGPEVRVLDHRRRRLRGRPPRRGGAGPRAARAALATSGQPDLRLLRLRGRRAPGARAARPGVRRARRRRCPRWTSAAASASPTPPRTTRPTRRSSRPR